MEPVDDASRVSQPFARMDTEVGSPAGLSTASAAQLGAALPAIAPRVLATAALAARVGGQITVEGIRGLESIVRSLAHPSGRVTPALQDEFRALETLRPLFGSGASFAFQELVAQTGGEIHAPIEYRATALTFWEATRSGNDTVAAAPVPRLHNYRSTPSLPERARIVVLGTGIAGAAHAHFLAKRGYDVVFLEAGPGVASGASSRNGGNDERVREGWIPRADGTIPPYGGFRRVRFDALKRRSPTGNTRALLRQAKQIANGAIRNSLRTGVLRREIIAEHGLECGYQQVGSVRVSDHPCEDPRLQQESRYLSQAGLTVTTNSAEEIRRDEGIRAERMGRRVAEDATFHPADYVEGVFRSVLEKNENIKLYTGVRALSVTSTPNSQEVVTSEGAIRCEYVVNCLNAASGEVFPELQFIRPTRSHILAFMHVPLTLQGIFTGEMGDRYWNHPQVLRDGAFGALLAGGGVDHPMERADRRSHDPRIFAEVGAEVARLRPDLARRPHLYAWGGALMGFTSDRLPVAGPRIGPGIDPCRAKVIDCVGDSGYNSDYEALAWANAEYIANGRFPEDHPAEIYAIDRLAEWERDPGWAEKHRWW